MLRVHTQLVITTVQHMESVRNESEEHYPGHSMGVHHTNSSVHEESTVPVRRYETSPDPAHLRLLDFLHESLTDQS